MLGLFLFFSMTRGVAKFTRLEEIEEHMPSPALFVVMIIER